MPPAFANTRCKCGLLLRDTECFAESPKRVFDTHAIT
nr:MAG TPA: hypothetical protein [Caudoviricetes sp.]